LWRSATGARADAVLDCLAAAIVPAAAAIVQAAIKAIACSRADYTRAAFVVGPEERLLLYEPKSFNMTV